MIENDNVTDNTYGIIERRLRDENFNVLHLYRDYREDWGDDGGYLISISSKNDKIYLHILDVNYNFDVSCHILDENDKKLKGECFLDYHKDFIICKSVEDAQKEINKFVDILDKCVSNGFENNYHFYFEGEIKTDFSLIKDDKLKNILEKLKPFYLNFIANTVSSYNEYAKIDKKKMLNLSKKTYIPNYKSGYED